MGQLSLNLRAFQRVFIDRQNINRAVDRAGLRSMGRIGATLRRTARRSIRKRAPTAAQWRRYHAARAAGNRTAAARILDLINRRRREYSRPGQPPFAHSPDHPVASIRAIYFAAMPRNVVVGPVRASGTYLPGSNRQTVPELLEFGGYQSLTEYSPDGGETWIGTSHRNRRRHSNVRTRTIRQAPRPFMRPALVATRDEQLRILGMTFSRTL